MKKKPESKIEPFTAESLFNIATNDHPTYDRVNRGLRQIWDAINDLAEQQARANAAWHDDPKADDHADFHAPAELQYPPSVRANVVAELVLYYIRATPAGHAIDSKLQLEGSWS